MFPFLTIQMKLTGSLNTTVRRNVSDRVIEIVHSKIKKTPGGKRKHATIDDQKAEAIHLMRHKAFASVTHTIAGKGLRLQSASSVIGGVILVIYGIVFQCFMFVVLQRTEAGCSEKFGECLWQGTSPKILFVGGLLGAMDCGEQHISDIVASDCGITELESRFGNPLSYPALDSVVLSDNEIESVPFSLLDRDDLSLLELVNNPCVSELTLTGEGISELPSGFKEIFSSSLESLSLPDQQFTEFDFASQDVQYFSQLEKVDLTGNQITRIDNLRNFLENRASGLNDRKFLELKLKGNLIQLSGDYAQIFTTRELFAAAGYLHSLDLSDNAIHEIPLDFVSVYKDHDALKLGGNPLTEISWTGVQCVRALNGAMPNWISQLESVEDITVSSCKLTDVDTQHLGSLKSLKKLDLDDNVLQAVPSNLFEVLSPLRWVNLSGNR